MNRVHLDESICRGDSQSGLVAFEVSVGNFKLCLFSKRAVGKATLKFAVVVNGLLPVAGIPVLLSSLKKNLCCPVRGLVFFVENRTAAGQTDQNGEHSVKLKAFGHVATRSGSDPERLYCPDGPGRWLSVSIL